MTAYLAWGVLAAIPLFLVAGEIRHMARTMRFETEGVRESADAKLIAELARIDSLSSKAERIYAAMYADGILPDRREVAR